MKNKAQIGDLAARIRQATARLERAVARIGRYADDDQMGSLPYRATIQDAGKVLMTAMRRAEYTLGKGYLLSGALINALHDGNVAFTRARPLFLDPE